jgi:ribosomal protein L11 methyltransferase
MDYVKVSIQCDGELSEIMIAILGSIGYEGFEEDKGLLYAYINDADFDEQVLAEILKARMLSAEITTIKKINWNKQWEENFPPVIVDDFCTIRADFHDINVLSKYEIVITPKMSFGTGHHSTTQLMIESMRDIDFNGKVVLDFGTGTGILAILASMMQAEKIIGVDNEEWACENSRENSNRNNIDNIEIVQGSLDAIPDIAFEIILANINRHILLQYMVTMYSKLKAGGRILMSGILREDEEIITSSALNAGFKTLDIQTKNNWLVLSFTK